jgi:hypothetical protein
MPPDTRPVVRSGKRLWGRIGLWQCQWQGEDQKTPRQKCRYGSMAEGAG